MRGMGFQVFDCRWADARSRIFAPAKEAPAPYNVGGTVHLKGDGHARSATNLSPILVQVT